MVKREPISNKKKKKHKQNSQIQRKMVAKKVSFPRNFHGISICLIPNICADNL